MFLPKRRLMMYYLLYFIFGIITGFICILSMYTDIDLFVKRILDMQIKIVSRQIKLYERQCKILWMLRVRYKNKMAIKMFKKGNK